MPEREVPTTWDWSLLRKFNDFWPSTISAPHDFPWLGDLVTRERAWRWASQFPRFFALVEASDSDIIRAFIARTLTEVEPPSPYEGESEEEKKGCCKTKTPDPPVWVPAWGHDICEPGFVQSFCGPPCAPGQAGERYQLTSCEWVTSCTDGSSCQEDTKRIGASDTGGGGSLA